MFTRPTLVQEPPCAVERARRHAADGNPSSTATRKKSGFPGFIPETRGISGILSISVREIH